MTCIGSGPGPKNVLAEDTETGHRVVVPYAIWKHKLSKETTVSEVKKQYVTAVGMVQAFMKDGVKQPAVKYNEVSGQQVANVTIKTGTQVLLGISIWPELGHVAPHIEEGFGIIVDGAYSEKQGNNGQTYRSISAQRIVVMPCVKRVEREVVNAVPAQPAAAPAPATAAAPTAAPAPAAAAPAASPFAF